MNGPIRLVADSMGHRGLAAELSRLLGVTVEDHAVGGDDMSQILARFRRFPSPGYTIVWGGHPDTVLGRTDAVIAGMAEIAAGSLGTLILQWQINDDAAANVGRYAGALDRVRALTATVASRYPAVKLSDPRMLSRVNGFYPLRDDVCAWARTWPDLTSEERSGLVVDLMPDRMRDDDGNDGHLEYGDQGVNVVAVFIARAVLTLDWPTAASGYPQMPPVPKAEGPAGPGTPPVPPVDPPSPPIGPGLGLWAFLRSLIRRRRPLRG